MIRRNIWIPNGLSGPWKGVAGSVWAVYRSYIRTFFSLDRCNIAYRSDSTAEADDCISASDEGRIIRPGDARVDDRASLDTYGNDGVIPASCEGAEAGEG